MTISSDPQKDEQTARFRAILRGDDEQSPAPLQEPPRSFLDRLPRAQKTASASPEPSTAKPVPAFSTPSPAKASARNQPLEPGPGQMSRVQRAKKIFWDTSRWVGLAVDAILIAIVIILLWYVRGLNLKINELMELSNLPLETVSGLYENFEKMNNAHIVATIEYATEIPVQFDLQINQQTEVVLSQDVRINGAVVTLVAGGALLSNTPANIILPAGTSLPITLSLTVPVDKRVPVSLQVPVDIDLATSDLGPAFTGLMDVLEPLYCMLAPDAVDSMKVSICLKADTP